MALKEPGAGMGRGEVGDMPGHPQGLATTS